MQDNFPSKVCKGCSKSSKRHNAILCSLMTGKRVSHLEIIYEFTISHTEFLFSVTFISLMRHVAFPIL